MKNKLLSLEDAEKQIQNWKRFGWKNFGFANGCFDLLHVGHISLLSQAKAKCEKLIVAINSDASVKRLKGQTRPIISELNRATVLSALECVDMVVIFDEDTPLETITRLRPTLLVKGSDYTIDKVVGANLVQSYGGKVLLVNLEEGHSTTSTIQKMKSPAGSEHQ